MIDVLVDLRTAEDDETFPVWLEDGSKKWITIRFVFESVLLIDGTKGESLTAKRLFTDSGDECFCNFQDGMVSSVLVPWNLGHGRKEFREAKFRLEG